MNDLQGRYLAAMDIPLWVTRTRPAQLDDTVGLIRLGPGTGASLFICAGPEASSSRLAADLARALAEPPVWSWPANGEDALDVSSAVGERLFSSITVFGQELAQALFGPEPPDRLSGARLRVAASLSELEGSATQRRAFWKTLSGLSSPGES